MRALLFAIAAGGLTPGAHAGPPSNKPKAEVAGIGVTPGGVKALAKLSINRKDFGIIYRGKADDLIRDNVVLRLDLQTGPKK